MTLKSLVPHSERVSVPLIDQAFLAETHLVSGKRASTIHSTTNEPDHTVERKHLDVTRLHFVFRYALLKVLDTFLSLDISERLEGLNLWWQGGLVDRLEVKQDSDGLSDLQEYRCQVPVLNRSRNLLIDVDQSSDASKEVLEEAHYECGEVREEIKLLRREDRHVFNHVIADHGRVCRVSQRFGTVEQVVVEVTIEVSPLQEGSFVEP